MEEERTTSADPIDRLASIIGEDAQEGEGALDTAIRILARQKEARERWKRREESMQKTITMSWNQSVLVTAGVGFAIGLMWGFILTRK